MTGFITLITIGSIISSVFMFFLFKNMHKEINRRRLIRKIGKTTEKKINKDLASYALHTKNKMMKASLFKYGVDKVFEVDSILITKEAIYVVEIKSVKGNVVGDANDANLWKMKNEKKYSIKNPIIQNDKHIQHIKNILGIRVPIVSLIVFGDSTDYIDIKNIPSHVLICKKNNLYDKLDEASATLKSIMTPTHVNTIFKKIKSNKSSNLKHKFLHWRITRGM